MTKVKSKSTTHAAPRAYRPGRALVAVLATLATVTAAAQALTPARAAAAMDLGNGCVMYDWPIIICDDPAEGGGSEAVTSTTGSSASTPVVVDPGTPGPGAADTSDSAGGGDQASGPVNPDEVEVSWAEQRMRSNACHRLQQRIAHMPRMHNGRPSDLPGGLRDDLFRRFEDGGCGGR